MLQQLDIGTIWDEATTQERRQLLKAFLNAVYFFPDHLEIEVLGAPRLNIALEEVGMKGVSTGGVGGPIRTRRPRWCCGRSWRWRGDRYGLRRSILWKISLT